jgi:HD-GYP domain-containing protein (c-di-GMP phosphodiesterase class II)/anti-anti-sigma regulatory factor
MAGTKFERLEIGGPNVAVFRISGKLGFHENHKIKKLTGECDKRNFKKVVFDFSELTSLGGGVAKILREFVRNYKQKGNEVVFVVTNEIVLQFLHDAENSITVVPSLSDVIADASRSIDKAATDVDDSSGSKEADAAEEAQQGEGDELKIERPEDFLAAEQARSKEQAAEQDKEAPLVDSSGVILMSYDGEIMQDAEGSAEEQPEEAPEAETTEAPEPEEAPEVEPEGPGPEKPKESEPDSRKNGKDKKKTSGKESKKEKAPAAEKKEKKPDKKNEAVSSEAPQAAGKGKQDGQNSEGIFTEIFGEEPGEKPPEWIDQPTSPFTGGKADSVEVVNDEEDIEQLNKRMKRRILEFKTLFSISAEFSSIRDRKKLLDIFLLTSIAQGGVESAVFLEKQDDIFMPFMSKGMGHDNIESLKLSAGIAEEIVNEYNVVPVSSISMSKGEQKALKKEGLEYLCPFRRKDELAGLVLLGKRIAGRGMKEEDFEFLRILINIAQGAYDNAVMFESEHERTLGIVKTLISLIEENTLVKGSSEFVSRYVGMVAKNMDYPEEHFKELIYATVLRDMGMIKISDVILRSPRELTKEEWDIIQRHPEDGAEMLERMQFSKHVIEIVKSHHERFNGEGYPLGIRGKEIPLGARIISVVESYDAMIHERPSRPALSEKEALESLKENYGLRYDREVVAQFAKIMEKEIAKSVTTETTTA